MSARDDRDGMRAELARLWVGPADGEQEVLERNPIYAYLVGILFPAEAGTGPAVDPQLPTSIASNDATGSDAVGSAAADEDADDADAEDVGIALTGAFGWAPQSAGLSFVHDGAGVMVTVTAGAYVADETSTLETETETETEEKRGPVWRRTPLAVAVPLGAEASGELSVFDGTAKISWRRRPLAGRELITVAVSNAIEVGVGEAKRDPSKCLFQVQLQCASIDGDIRPYPIADPISVSPEELELELRYSSKKAYAIGHGAAAAWPLGDAPAAVYTSAFPSHEVRAIRARAGDDDVLSMRVLADESAEFAIIADGLRNFIAKYESWIEGQAVVAGTTGPRHHEVASDLVARQRTAASRMREGVTLLEADLSAQHAFRMANAAMRHQFLQQQVASKHPGVVGRGLALIPEASDEPRWRPFQLGFLLETLASTADEGHDDRGTVDLIWFPTGGGKTEAYLGLAAFEMIRRRLVDPRRGGGTAVITRYTMRLLTAQQFQRASALICALEIMRVEDHRLSGAAPFTIGLWVGNSTTPGDYASAAKERQQVLKANKPHNAFQVRSCPWCATAILPERRVADESAYGIRAGKSFFEFFCPHPECTFHEKLPLQVVDEGLYDAPPTMLVATVDKFARLAWIDRGGEFFGLGSTGYAPPSLLIQDELHLLAGPLGTIVGVYEAALSSLLAWTGSRPKVVASTATARAAREQVGALMAREVAVFPPSGLDADDSYFAEPDDENPGRLYAGIMPQAQTPSWSLGQLSSGMLQAPVSLGLDGETLDAYWTLVVYHNSLRELGRTMTILRDDVRTALDRRANDDGQWRTMVRDGVEELNGNVGSDELLEILDHLSVGPDSGDRDALDALVTTNIMSVGIDVTRLGVMLVNGHPKSTAEYIQATSRVGRGKVPGLVVTMFRSGKPRDRSVFESFQSFHDAFYRQVEPASVVPWSSQARRRALRAGLVILMRHGAGLRRDGDAGGFDRDGAFAQKAVHLLAEHVGTADPREAEAVRRELLDAVDAWAARVATVRAEGGALRYKAKDAEQRLLKQYTDSGVGWPTMNSMRSVDHVVRVRAKGERE